MEEKMKQQIHYGAQTLRYRYWCAILAVGLVLLTIVLSWIDVTAGCVAAVFMIVYGLVRLFLYFYFRSRILQEMMEFSHNYSTLQNDMLQEFAIPHGLASMDGKILWMNDRLMQLTGKSANFHGSVSSLFSDLTVDQFPQEGKEKEIEVDFHEKRFCVNMRRVTMDDSMREKKVSDSTDMVVLNFFDITELTFYRKENQEQKQVVGLLYLDNYDEVMESIEDIRKSMLEALVDRRITKYISGVDGVCKKMEKDRYFFVVNRKGLGGMMEDRFSVLEDVKTINIGNTLRVTLSMGIGVGNGSYAQDSEAARGAMELSLARGGDQVAVKEGNKIQFYGGKTQRTENNTRVRARVKAQALKEMIRTRERVVAMGHKITDIDSFGACIGVCRAAVQEGKKAYIVLGEQSGNIRFWENMIREKGTFDEDIFITHEQAIAMTNANTVLVVADTNRPSMVECEKLLHQTKSIVVLDHHRQTPEKIENASLSYIEPSASSACEMITELLQYYDDGIRLNPYEADCIYAGIVVDTNKFMSKTGSRTFEAAAFLKKYGADVTRVRKAFRNDMKTYKARAEAVRHAETFMDVYAISVCPSDGIESPTVVGAQAANELLNIIGVKASFVLTQYDQKIFVSARAIDEVNVQIIMERMGGGGHLNIAGAQLTGKTMEEAIGELKSILRQMTEEGAI